MIRIKTFYQSVIVVVVLLLRTTNIFHLLVSSSNSKSIYYILNFNILTSPGNLRYTAATWGCGGSLTLYLDPVKCHFKHFMVAPLTSLCLTVPACISCI